MTVVVFKVVTRVRVWPADYKRQDSRGRGSWVVEQSKRGWSDFTPNTVVLLATYY